MEQPQSKQQEVSPAWPQWTIAANAENMEFQRDGAVRITTKMHHWIWETPACSWMKHAATLYCMYDAARPQEENSAQNQHLRPSWPNLVFFF
jgi:hypothetical protein